MDMSAKNYLAYLAADMARDYVRQRRAEAQQLLCDMKWHPGLVRGTMRCKLYGHSILHDIEGVLHAYDHVGKYEILPNGEDDPVADLSLNQVLAFLLARNW